MVAHDSDGMVIAFLSKRIRQPPAVANLEALACIGVSTGRVCAWLETDPNFSGGLKSKPKPTSINGRVVRFGSIGFRVCVDRFRVSPSVPKFCQIRRDLADIWPDPSNLD